MENKNSYKFKKRRFEANKTDKKAKVKVKVKFSLEEDMKTQMGAGGHRHAPAYLPQGKGLGTHCTGAGWAHWPVWTGAENLTCTGISNCELTSA